MLRKVARGSLPHRGGMAHFPTGPASAHPSTESSGPTHKSVESAHKPKNDHPNPHGQTSSVPRADQTTTQEDQGADGTSHEPPKSSTNQMGRNNDTDPSDHPQGSSRQDDKAPFPSGAPRESNSGLENDQKPKATEPPKQDGKLGAHQPVPEDDAGTHHPPNGPPDLPEHDSPDDRDPGHIKTHSQYDRSDPAGKHHISDSIRGHLGELGWGAADSLLQTGIGVIGDAASNAVGQAQGAVPDYNAQITSEEPQTGLDQLGVQGDVAHGVTPSDPSMDGPIVAEDEFEEEPGTAYEDAAARGGEHGAMGDGATEEPEDEGEHWYNGAHGLDNHHAISDAYNNVPHTGQTEQIGYGTDQYQEYERGYGDEEYGNEEYGYEHQGETGLEHQFGGYHFDEIENPMSGSDHPRMGSMPGDFHAGTALY